MGRSYGTPKARWEGLGPYYAMFPVSFADYVVRQFTRVGDHVLDPFAGRGTSLFSASVAGRAAAGIEINPVGWVYGRTKLAPAPLDHVETRVRELSAESGSVGDPRRQLPEFFAACYTREVLSFLTVARNRLDWRRSPTDRTVMAILLTYLHGKREQSFSNQMRQGKAMSPAYSVRWWRARGSVPPRVDPESFLIRRIRWRYAKGTPGVSGSELLLGDSCDILDRLLPLAPFHLLFTSPPYRGVTNYHYDQWLREWMLGEPPKPTVAQGPHSGRFYSEANYTALLRTVFGQAADLMHKRGHVYVRADARACTLEAILSALRESFPRWRIYVYPRPYNRNTQTALFGDRGRKPGEVDIVMCRS